MPINQKDIAEALGISQMSVSIALNQPDSKRISAELVDKIRNKAKEMGYFPSASAQILRTKPTDLGLLILLNYDAFRPNMEGHDAISNFVRECRLRDRKFQLEWFDPEQNFEELPRMLTDRLVGGIVCFGHASGTVAERLDHARIPVVKINEPGDFNVCFDMENDIMKAASALIERGHSRIGMFNCSVYQVFTKAKLGFLSAMREHGLEAACFCETRPDGPFTTDILAFVDQIAKQPPEKRPTVVMADTAITAKALVSALRKREIRIPEDIGVFTFCALDWEDEYFIPRLSGLEYDFENLIRSAVDLLLQRMNGDESTERHQVISQSIVFRDSVADLNLK